MRWRCGELRGSLHPSSRRKGDAAAFRDAQLTTADLGGPPRRLLDQQESATQALMEAVSTRADGDAAATDTRFHERIRVSRKPQTGAAEPERARSQAPPPSTPRPLQTMALLLPGTGAWLGRPGGPTAASVPRAGGVAGGGRTDNRRRHRPDRAGSAATWPGGRPPPGPVRLLSSQIRQTAGSQPEPGRWPAELDRAAKAHASTTSHRLRAVGRYPSRSTASGAPAICRESATAAAAVSPETSQRLRAAGPGRRGETARSRAGHLRELGTRARPTAAKLGIAYEQSGYLEAMEPAAEQPSGGDGRPRGRP